MAEATSGRFAAGYDPDFEAVDRSGFLARLADAAEAERAQWFNWLPVLFGLGIGLYFSLRFEPPLVWALAPLGVALALAAARLPGLPVVIVAVLVAVSAGFAAAKIRTEMTRAPVLARHIGPIEARGFVELVEPRATRGVRITLRLVSLGDFPPEGSPRRVRIRTLGPTPDLRPGDGVRIRATLAPPAAPALPGGYDFARAAWFQGLGAVGYTMRSPEIDDGLGPVPSRLIFSSAIERWRQSIGARVRTALPGETGSIANALITGERGGITPGTNDAFRDSGLLHILSISGLHMVVMAGAVFYLARLLLAMVPALALRYPIKKWAAAAAAIAALGYLMISGAAFATVRSYIMISIVFLAVLLDRPALAMRNIAIAALLILALFPESLLDVGFQMSFAAVVALVAVYELLSRRAEEREVRYRGALVRAVMFFGGIALSTLVAGFAVAPFAAYHFHTSQQFAIIANLIAIPICNLIVMPAALLTLVAMPLGLEAPALWLMGQGIEAMTWCARYAASLPGAVGHIAALPHSAFLLMVAGGLWLCLWSTRWRLLGLGALALGAAMSATPELPVLLAGRDGSLVAVRGADGLLSAAGGRKSDFELKRWLEHDGDARPMADAAAAKAFRCDSIGCTAAVNGAILSLARHPAALADDCRRARILVLDFPAPRGCSGPGHVIDFFKLRNEGTHALYFDGTSDWRIETVASARGERPWSPRGTLGMQKGGERRTSLTAKPQSTSPSQVAPPRPEIEDEDQSEAWDVE